MSRPTPASPRLSVVIPAYNEADRITAPLRQIDGYLRRFEPESEIVLVDDGSTDGTAEVVSRLAPSLVTPLVVLGSAVNRGKGDAVRRGMLAARGQTILMTDADLSTPIEELPRLYAAQRDGAAVVIGSRKMPGAVLEHRQPLLRETMGRVFTGLTRLLVVDVSDVTCGFKLFAGAAGREIFSHVTLRDWSFDAEALFLARRLGFPICEVPVRWHDVPGTKVHRGRDAVRSALGLGRILLNAARGRYPAVRQREPAALPAGAGRD